MARSLPKLAVLPSSLRARLTVTIVFASVLLFVLVFSVTELVTLGQSRILAQADVVEHLGAIRGSIALDARQLDSFLVGYTERNAFYDRTRNPDPTFTRAELDPWLERRAGVSTVVWANRAGRSIFATGTADDIARLTEIALGDDDLVLGGPVLLPSGPAIIAIQPVTGDPAKDPAGFLAVARPITPGFLSGQISAQLENITIEDPAASAPDGWITLGAPSGFSAVYFSSAGPTVHALATMSGVDGAPVCALSLTSGDEWQALTSDVGRYVLPLGLGLVSMLLGLALGLLLAKSIRRPIETFVRYMRDHGYLATEGLPSRERLEINPGLPDELKDLGHVIQDLLTQLGVRQAALKRANEQIMAVEQAFRTVVNDSAEVKLLVREGLVDLANPAAAAYLDLPLGSILKQPISSLFEQMHMSTEAGETLTIDDLFDLALDRTATVRCDASSNGERWMRVSVSESAAPGTYLLTARNVTEEHRLEALREEIVSLVSHDLRAPLTVIAGYLEVLDRSLDGPERHKAVESAKTAANRMSALLGDLLDTTRTEQMFTPTVFRRVDLGNLADEIAESMRVGSGHDITVVKKQEAIALGDELRLRQAIENLVGNAIKHTPDGTEITLTVGVTGNRTVVTVEDRGPGIPEDRRTSVFDRFARLNHEDGAEGVGLGLYIVRVIAESHGGKVSVEDAPLGGARFVLEVPVAPRARRVKSDGQRDDEPQSDGSPSA